MNIFFQNTIPYKNFTLEHVFALLIIGLLTCILIVRQKNTSYTQKRRVSIVLAFVPLMALIIRTIIDASIRPLTLQDDLPLHLCRILSLIAPIVILYGNRKAHKILYYLVLAGTLNAMITADIEFGFPHYGYFFYWIYHGILVVLALYNLVIFKIHLSLKDGLHAFLIVNAYFVALHTINILIGANYMYSRYKPAVASIMDYLGDWPIYLFWLEILAILMILLIYLVLGKWAVPNNNGNPL